MSSATLVPRRFIAAGTSTAIAGIGLSATGASGAGSLVTVVGLAILIAGIHTFGRKGPDEGG